MKIYLAGRYSSRLKLLGFAKTLELQGHSINATAIWLTGQTDDACPVECASNDIKDLNESDLLLCFTEEVGRNGGSYVELGMALAKGIPAIIVGPYTNVFTRLCRRIDDVRELTKERTERK